MELQRTKKVDALTLLSMVDGPWRRAETNPAKFGVWGKVSEESTTVSGDARIPSHHGAKKVCVQLFFTSADNVASPTIAALCRVAARCCERRAAAAVDRYLMPARRSAANSPQQHAVIGEGWDGQTDGRTDGRAGRRPTVSQILLCVLCGQCLQAGNIIYFRLVGIARIVRRAGSVKQRLYYSLYYATQRLYYSLCVANKPDMPILNLFDRQTPSHSIRPMPRYA